MYELIFWKYLEEVYLNHQEVYEALDDETAIEGLEELPVQVILNRIASVFSKWEKVDENSWLLSVVSFIVSLKNSTIKGCHFHQG